MKQTILTFLLFLGLSIHAQEKAKQTYSFTIQQAVEHALKNNATAINAGRDIESAQQKKRETTAMGLPQINAAVDYTNNFDIPKTLIPAQIIDPAAPEGTFAAVEFAPKQSINSRATINQLIFDGSYIVALRASKTYLQYYRNLKERTDSNVREMVIESYGNVLLAEESIIILEKNKGILDKTLFDTRETFKNGLIEEENVEQLEITQLSINSSLSNARRLKEIALNMLKINLGLSFEDDLTLTDKLDAMATENLSQTAIAEFNIENSIDYKIGQNFQDQRRLELQREKSRALPSLSAAYNLGYSGYGDKKFEFLNSNQDWFFYSNIGVSLNIPIFSSFARSARTQQAKIAYDQAKTLLTETEQKLKLQYANAKSQLEYSIEEYDNAKSNLDLAQRIESKQQTKFTEGLSSSFEFAEAQRQLYSAQQNYLQSMINVINRRAQLERITNAK